MTVCLPGLFGTAGFKTVCLPGLFGTASFMTMTTGAVLTILQGFMTLTIMSYRAVWYCGFYDCVLQLLITFI